MKSCSSRRRDGHKLESGVNILLHICSKKVNMFLYGVNF